MGYSKLLTAVVFPFVFVLSLLLTNANTYNIDVKTVRKFTGPKNSKFGYSVAQYKEKGVSWLIVGAPYAKFNGTVYRCDPKTDDRCSEFDRAIRATTENSYNKQFGVIVQTSGVDGVILTCDSWYREKGKQIGMCYLISDNFTKIVGFSLCRQDRSCVGMFAASISQDSKFMYIKTSDGYKDYISSVMKDGVYDKQFDYYASQAMMPNSTIYVKGITSDTLWLEYSAPIKLPITSKEEGFVDGVVMVGRTTSKKKFNEVLVYTWDFTKVKTLVIDKVDAYCRNDWICVADVDGDGKQDIIVAVEVEKRSNIHVYYQGGHVCSLNDQKCWENTFNRTTILDNYDSKTPRVHYLASLGDINQDGCEDFAVTVYSESFTDSAVYIYHGSVDGVRNQPSQILGAREIAGITSPSHFGYSIAGGFDLDNNGYPDITVGSFDVVYHFRSKPVVRVMANLTYLLNTKYIDINQTVSRKITLRLCLRYTGIGVHPTSELNTTVTLDSLKPNSPRLIFNGQRLVEVFTLTKNDTMCKDYVTILKCIIEDTSTPIVAILNYSLLDSNYTELGQILDPHYTGKHNDWLYIKYDGVSVNICIPELDLKLTSDVEIYRVETCDKVVVNVSIENRKFDSFGTKLYLDIPLGLTYAKFDQSTDTKDQIYCHSLKQTALICDLGNTLPGLALVKFRLIFEPVYVDTKMRNYTFVGILNCTNPYFKPTAADNVKTFVLPILPNVNISLTGQSYPERVHFNYSDYNYSVDRIEEDVQAGPPLDHKYTVINMGPSIVSTAELIIYWPSYTDTGDNLLYLLYEPDVKGNVSCLHIDANHLNLKLVSLRKDYVYDRDSDSSAKTRPGEASINYEVRLPGRNRNSAEGSEENCGTAKCTMIKCTISQLGKNEEAAIVLRSLIWIKTLQQKLKFNQEIVFTSKATVAITEFPQIGKLGLQWNRTFNIFTNVISDDADPPTSNKIWLLWIIILLLVIGIFVAFLVIYLLRKGRFYEINRSSNVIFDME